MNRTLAICRKIKKKNFFFRLSESQMEERKKKEYLNTLRLRPEISPNLVKD